MPSPTAIRRVTLYQVDAFTTEPFTGNPAGVVPDATGLSEAEMQAIARELGNPETAFVRPGTADDEVVVRFFSPTREVPVCGHATLATHFVRAVRSGETDVRHRVRQRSPGGEWTIEVEPDGHAPRIWMIQKPVTFGPALKEDEVFGLLAALGATPADLRSGAPVRVVSTGHAKVLIALRSASTIDTLAPDREALLTISAESGRDGFFIFALDSAEPGILAECRMFAPALGIDEDPVTGSGHGPLGAYLVRYGLIRLVDGRAAFRSVQGRAMGRPGRVDVVVEAERGAPVRVRVGGRARIVFRGELEL